MPTRLGEKDRDRVELTLAQRPDLRALAERFRSEQDALRLGCCRAVHRSPQNSTLSPVCSCALVRPVRPTGLRVSGGAMYLLPPLCWWSVWEWG